MRTVTLVGVGGVVGALSRYALDIAFGFTPWATFLVNVVGCFAIGIAVARVADRPSAPFWVAGVLGGFTTFSAFAAEAVILMLDAQVAWALGYIGATLFLGLLAVPLGHRLAVRQ